MSLTASLTIRECAPDDSAALDSLYTDAFPDEELVPLVRALSVHPTTLALVAEIGGAVVGHVVLSECGIDGVKNDGGGSGSTRAALLGPLAVAAPRRGHGIGRRLVNEGVTRMTARGLPLTVLLGDPAYCGRLGFRTETAIEPPYPLPDKWRTAWQSRHADDAPSCAGRLVVPEPWRKPELWSD